MVFYQWAASGSSNSNYKKPNNKRQKANKKRKRFHGHSFGQVICIDRRSKAGTVTASQLNDKFTDPDLDLNSARPEGYGLFRTQRAQLLCFHSSSSVSSSGSQPQSSDTRWWHTRGKEGRSSAGLWGDHVKLAATALTELCDKQISFSAGSLENHMMQTTGKWVRCRLSN